MMILMFIITMALFFFTDSYVVSEAPETKVVDFVWDNSKRIVFMQGKPDASYLYGKSKGTFCALYDGSGTFVGGELPKGFDSDEVNFISGELRSVRQNGIDYYVYDLARSSGTHSAWLRGVIRASTTHALMLKMINIAFFLLVPLVAIGIIGANYISKRTFTPINELMEKAAEISNSGSLSARLEIKKGSEEIHRLTDTFNSMFARLESSFNTEKQFVSDASHELRTPTTVILAECSRAKKKAKTKEDFDASISVIEEQGNKMKQMISQLLAMTKLDQSSDRIRLQEADFSAFVTVCSEEFSPQNTRGISFSTQIQPNIKVAFDAGLMFRVIQNLLENAYKYGRENGKILLCLERKNGSAILSVSDNGIGISKEDRPNIFNRFWQADSSRGEDQGVGLGLAMVKQICEFHGGTVGVVSEPGVGSTFIVTLPIK